jgi:predicted DNA-binding protein with PD1-like motif
MRVVSERGNQGERHFVVALKTGDDLFASLLEFAKSVELVSGTVSGIGAFESCRLAYWDASRREYLPKDIDEQMEVAALTGNVSLKPTAELMVHCHAVLAASDLSAKAGHLLEARVHPTLELAILETDQPLAREQDPETSLALLPR